MKSENENFISLNFLWSENENWKLKIDLFLQFKTGFFFFICGGYSKTVERLKLRQVTLNKINK